MSDRRVVTITRMIEMLGEDGANELIFNYSCPLNPEIERFFKNRAIDFTKRSISITHVVSDSDGRMLGYYTLACRPLNVAPEAVSKTMLKKVATHGAFDEGSGRYTLSAFLIAQLGKNFAADGGRGISGDELMGAAIDTLAAARELIVGGFIFLEAEDRPALLSFYQNDSNRFRPFSARAASDGVHYVQLLRHF